MSKKYQIINLDKEIKELDELLKNTKIENELIKIRSARKRLLLKKFKLENDYYITRKLCR